MVFISKNGKAGIYTIEEQELIWINSTFPIIQVGCMAIKDDKIIIFLLDYKGFLWRYEPEKDKMVFVEKCISSFQVLSTNNLVLHNSDLNKLDLFETYEKYFEFTPISFDIKVKMISSGRDHIVIIDENYFVWSQGSNFNGQLGLHEQIQSTKTFGKIPTEQKFISVSCGEIHSVFLSSLQNIYVCGNNLNGKLGIKTRKENIKNLKLIKELHLISNISCGRNSSSCIDIHGNLYRFGINIGIKDKLIHKINIPNSVISLSKSHNQDDLVVLDILENIWYIRDISITKISSDEKLNCGYNENYNLTHFDAIQQRREQYVCFIYFFLYKYLIF